MAKGVYDVNETNVGPTKDGSFRSMLCAMLVFVSICGIILIIAWPWRNSTDNGRPSSYKGNKPIYSDPNETLELKNPSEHKPKEKPGKYKPDYEQKYTTTESNNKIFEKNETQKIVNKPEENFDESRETETVTDGAPKVSNTNSSKLIISTTTAETQVTTEITRTAVLSNNSKSDKTSDFETNTSNTTANPDLKKQTEKSEDTKTSTDASVQSGNNATKDPKEPTEKPEDNKTSTDASVQFGNNATKDPKEPTEKPEDNKTSTYASIQAGNNATKDPKEPTEKPEDNKTSSDASLIFGYVDNKDSKEQTDKPEDNKTSTVASVQSGNENNKDSKEQSEKPENDKSSTDAALISENESNKDSNEQTEKPEDNRTSTVASVHSENENNKYSKEQLEKSKDDKATTNALLESGNEGNKDSNEQTEKPEDNRTSTVVSVLTLSENNKDSKEQPEKPENDKSSTDASLISGNESNKDSKEQTEIPEDNKTSTVASVQSENENNKYSKEQAEKSNDSGNEGNKDSNEQTEKPEDNRTSTVTSVLTGSENNKDSKEQPEKPENDKSSTDTSLISGNESNKDSKEQTEKPEDDKTSTDASVQSGNKVTKDQKEQIEKSKDDKATIKVLLKSGYEDNKDSNEHTEIPEDNITSTTASVQSENNNNSKEQTEKPEDEKSSTDASVQHKTKENVEILDSNSQSRNEEKRDSNEQTDKQSSSEQELSTVPSTLSTHMEIYETDNVDQNKRFTEPPKNLNQNTDDVDECKAECRKVGARILSRMNHSADPCEQFYDYACGGDNSDNASEDNWKRIAGGLDRIRAKSSAVYKTFQKFYDSCVDFHTNYDYHQRMAEAKHILSSVGEMYDYEEDGDAADSALTDLLTRLLQLDSSPLFDISMDVDKETKHFIFQLNIGKRFSALQDDHTVMSKKRKCINIGKKHFDFSLSFFDYMNLNEMHQVYLQCMHNETHNNETLIRALEDFELYELEPSIEHIAKIVEKFNKAYPSTAGVRKDIITKKIVYRKVSELAFHYPKIQWKQLLSNLVGKDVHEEDLVQVYFSDFFFKLFSRQQTLKSPDLYNAIYAMYVEDLYTNLVLPTPMENPKEFCLHQSSDLMKEVASSLYLESLSPKEIEVDLMRVKDLFKRMQNKLRDMTQHAEWLDTSARLSLNKKIGQMVLDTTWEHSPLLKNDSVIQERMKSINRTYGNYSDFATALVRRNREMLYKMWDSMGYDESNLWWYFITPYSTNPVSVYALNRIAIPPAMLLTSSKDIPRYVSLAKLGYSLAKAIGYHFDYTGSKYAMNIEDTKEKAAYKEADTCSISMSYSNQKTVTYDGKNLQFQVNEDSLKLSLNERFVEDMAINLLSAMSNEDVSDYQISWIASNRNLAKLFSPEKMFFIALGQEHCRKPSLEDYFLHLFESEHLPPSLLLDTTLSHSELFYQVFDCKVGSRLNGVYKCKAFPEWPEPDPEEYENK